MHGCTTICLSTLLVEIIIVCSLRLLRKSCYENSCTTLFVNTFFFFISSGSRIAELYGKCMFNFRSNYQIVFQNGCIFPPAKFESPVCFTSLPVLGIAGLFNFSNLVRPEWSLTQAHIYPPSNIFWNHRSHPTPSLHLLWPSLCFSHALGSFPGISSSHNFHNWPLLIIQVSHKCYLLKSLSSPLSLLVSSTLFITLPYFCLCSSEPHLKESCLFVCLLTACPIRTLAAWTKISCLFLPWTVPNR